MALRADDLYKQQGDEGEDRFAAAVDALPKIAKWFTCLRNVRMHLNQADLDVMGSGLSVAEYESKFVTTGDLDFVFVGPTGVWLFDVKNLTRPMTPERVAYASQGMILQRDFLAVKLRHVFNITGSEPHCGFVMAGEQQAFDHIGEFPVYPIQGAIATMATAPEDMVMEHLTRIRGFVAEELAAA